MRTKIDALYDLVHKMNGAGVKDDSIVEMIDQITKAYEGGGGSSSNSFSLHTPIVFEGEEKTAEITDQQDIAMLESFYSSLLNGNCTMPNIYQDEFADIYEDDGQTYTYKQRLTYKANITIDTYYADNVCIIECSSIFGSYTLPPTEFALSDFGITLVAFIRNEEGKWTYNKDVKSVTQI